VRCKIIAEFVDSVLRENASRAVGRLAPLSFRQAKERWGDVVERYPSNRYGRNEGKQQQQQQSGFGGGSGGSSGSSGGGGPGQQCGGGGATARGRSARFQVNGKMHGVCFEFNRNNCNRKPSGCGCEERGVVYAYVCNFFFQAQNKHCLAQHPRMGNH
jgi:hypothetical protein